MASGAEIGIIGGTGVYDSGLLKNAERIPAETPYGKASDEITAGTFNGRRIAFIPRHGRRHALAPHMINYRANVWALREMGVTRIVAPSAVGSLKEEIEPGHFALPSQFIDYTKSRIGSFAEEGRVIHISVADPFCPELHACVGRVARDRGIRMHQDCTYVCIEGPRFSTKAESNMYRSIGADIIGMTLVPECQLAREAQICYVTVAMVTDYDVWAERPVTAKEVTSTISRNTSTFRGLLTDLVGQIPAARKCSCASALADATL